MSPWSSVIYYVVQITTWKTLHQTVSSELFIFMRWIFNEVLSSYKEFMNYLYFGRYCSDELCSWKFSNSLLRIVQHFWAKIRWTFDFSYSCEAVSYWNESVKELPGRFRSWRWKFSNLSFEILEDVC